MSLSNQYSFVRINLITIYDMMADEYCEMMDECRPKTEMSTLEKKGFYSLVYQRQQIQKM